MKITSPSLKSEVIIGSRKKEGTIEKAGIEAIKGRQRGIPKALPDIDSALHLHPTATIKALPRIATRREDNDSSRNFQ